MCVFGRSSPQAAPMRIAATDNREALAQGDAEARLRRIRAGAAANILTSARGIPSTRQLGAVAA
jgi:hypothetical protein